MGIKNLSIILSKHCSNAINIRKLDNYRGKKFGIDISIFLYKYLYNNDDHIEGITRLLLRLMKNQITPIVFFDGKPPKEKDNTIQDRKDKRDFLVTKKNLLNYCINIDKNDFEDFKNNIMKYIEDSNSSYIIDDDEILELFQESEENLLKNYDKVNKKIIYVTQQHIETTKKLLDLFGVKYIHENCEAESLLAYFCKKGIIDGCISEDTDVLANGGCLFIRNFNSDKNIVQEYCLYGILDCLKLTYEEFIDMCILCGCDYTPKINGMGPVTAYKLISKFKTIEEVLKNNNKYTIPDNFDYEKARELFKFPVSNELYEKTDKNIKLNKPNIIELLDFLKNTKLKEKSIHEINNSLINYYLNIEGPEIYGLPSVKLRKITDFFSHK